MNTKQLVNNIRIADISNTLLTAFFTNAVSHFNFPRILCSGSSASYLSFLASSLGLSSTTPDPVEEKKDDSGDIVIIPLLGCS